MKKSLSEKNEYSLEKAITFLSQKLILVDDVRVRMIDAKGLFYTPVDTWRIIRGYHPFYYVNMTGYRGFSFMGYKFCVVIKSSETQSCYVVEESSGVRIDRDCYDNHEVAIRSAMAIFRKNYKRLRTALVEFNDAEKGIRVQGYELASLIS